MYKINDKHGTLCTPWGTWHGGEAFIPNPSIPQEKLLAWRKAGIIITDEDGPDVEEIMDTSDLLTALNRQALMMVIKLNGLNTSSDGLAVKPRTSWTDEMIRQAIRDSVPSLTALVLPSIQTSEPVL